MVVRSGNTGIGGDEGSGEGRDKEKRRAGGAKRERVPVPVLCTGQHYTQLETWKALKIPVRAMLAVFQDVPDQIEVLVFLMLMKLFVPVRIRAPFYLCHLSYNCCQMLSAALLLASPSRTQTRHVRK